MESAGLRGRGHMVLRLLCITVLAAVASFAIGGVAHAAKGAKGAPPFEPIAKQEIKIPGVKEAAQPAYATYGKHLLFSGDYQLWIVGTNGKKASCLTCDLPPTWDRALNGPDDITTTPFNEDAPDQPALIQPFPDGKRIFFGPYGSSYVLDCTPSVVNCKSKTVLPIDYSGAQPAAIAPGGAIANPALYIKQVSSPKLSPDGQYVAFSDIRTDAVETMILAKLTEEGDKYTATDPRVLNPQGPTSLADPDVDAWSRSTGLFEFKTFVDGGRAVTYVQVGGEASGNPDIWRLDLATGERTRLTSYPDWDEDMAMSPDGKTMVAQFGRSFHIIDSLGALLPFRGFFDAPLTASAASFFVSNDRRRCNIGDDWLLPASGDQGGKLLGQPTLTYRGKGDVHLTGNLNGWPAWSPDSTAVAQTTQRFSNSKPTNYLVIAHFPARKPTRPLSIASSAPGAWAPTQEQYHGGLGAVGTITLHGKASGTVDVTYNTPLGIAGGSASAVYHDYSDDGKRFINGTDSTNYADGPYESHVQTDLTMTGSKTGYLRRDLQFSQDASGAEQLVGSSTVNYDGKTLEGPRRPDLGCPDLQKQYLTKHPLDVKAKRTKGGDVVVTVRAAFKQAGANESGVDRRPVVGAQVAIGGEKVLTNRKGQARIEADGKRLRVSAGDTFKRASVRIG